MMIIKAHVFQSSYIIFYKVFNIKVLNNKNVLSNSV